ncbi:MAG: hypothetical protein QM747_12900 [Nocardioides sp.]
MSVSQQHATRSEAEEAETLPTQHLRRRLIVSALVLVALAAGALGVRWWTHPDLFTPDNAGGDMSWGPLPLAKSQVTFGVTSPERGADGTPITFRSVPTVDLAENSAQATVRVSTCHPRSDIPHPTVIGSLRGTGRHYCTITPIVDGTRYTFRGPDYIIATITPKTPGRVLITGMGFHYATGRADWYRRGVDSLSMRVAMRHIE